MLLILTKQAPAALAFHQPGREKKAYVTHTDTTKPRIAVVRWDLVSQNAQYIR